MLATTYLPGQGWEYLIYFFLIYFLKDFIHSFSERRREGEREGEKQQCVVAPHTSPTGDLACNPGMRPDRELNPRPLGSPDGTQSTEPRQPGREYLI